MSTEYSDLYYTEAENYYYGKEGKYQSYEAAYHFYMKSAKIGNEQAMFMVGWMNL